MTRSSLAGLVREAAARLRDRIGAHQQPALDAELLARHVLGWTRETWIIRSREAAPAEFETAFNALVARRLTGEPVAYITGTREFWGLDFEVTPAVLIPRPETELLVERAISTIDELASSAGGGLRVADVGTGSGCIAIALAHERPSIQVIATDVSEAAIDVASRNAARLGVADRVDFRVTSLLDGVADVDLVVSNPPYIATGDPNVMPDVRAHEPRAALFSGADGLDVIRALAADVAHRSPSPPLLLEFGGNEQDVRDALTGAGLRVTDVLRDLAGIPRIAVAGR